MTKLTLQQVQSILEQKLILTDLPISGVATDSRLVQKGHLFVALKGQKCDGHDFLRQVESREAVAAIVDKTASFPNVNIPLIRVDSPLQALQSLAKNQIAASGAKVVAVTGSLGKTMTKEFIFSLLSSKYKTMVTAGNQNSQVGLSLSILNGCTGDEEYLVLEMGMTEAGHIRRLVEIAPPDIALVTYIALMHAENFESLEAIAEAKKEIFSHPKTQVGIINFDSPCHELLSQSDLSTLTGYSIHSSKADIRMELSRETAKFFESSTSVTLPLPSLPATHVYVNMLAACTVARSCGMNWEEIGRVLPSLKLPQRRLQCLEKQGITFIDDSYNASEESLKAALTVLKKNGLKKRKIAVIGEMHGLGKYSQNCHKGVGEWALDCADLMVCLGKWCEPIVEVWEQAGLPVFWFLQFEELVEFLKKELKPEDRVLLKGANPNGLWRVLNEF